MLANLDNAIRHTPPSTIVPFGLGQEAAMVAILVAGHGPGIPPVERG